MARKLLFALACLYPTGARLGPLTDPHNVLGQLQSEYSRLQHEIGILKEKYAAAKREYEAEDRYSYFPFLCDGRLTGTSGTPYTGNSNVTTGTIYYTPYKGNRITLYYGGRWRIHYFTELSLSLTGYGATSAIYDVFVYSNGSAPALELSAAWSSDTARVDAVSLYEGVYTKTSDRTRLYVGSIRISSGQTFDTASARYLWSYCNRVSKTLGYMETTTGSWTYNSTTWRRGNNGGAALGSIAIGIGEVPIYAHGHHSADLAGSQLWASGGIGLDAGTNNVAMLMGGATNTVNGIVLDSDYYGYPGQGRHTVHWLESTDGGGNVTFWGTGGSTRITGGVYGWFEG